MGLTPNDMQITQLKFYVILHTQDTSLSENKNVLTKLLEPSEVTEQTGPGSFIMVKWKKIKLEITCTLVNVELNPAIF